MAAPQVVKPDPDPTLLTTESLLREINHLKELTEEKFQTRDVRANSIEARLDHKYVETADAIRNLRELTDEKFKGLAELAKQSREDAKTQLDTAFKSANDSQTQDRASFTKQIDNLSDKVETVNKATNEKIDRERSRGDMGEGKGFGVVESRHERTTDKGQSLVIVSIAIALGALVITAFRAMGGH